MFRSFWMAGYECADHLNAFGHRVDFRALTRHLEWIDRDYANLRPFGIQTVREGICWSQVETAPYVYEWASVGRMMDAGRSHGIQQIWDLCHFGFPDDLTPLHPMFARRFASLCSAFATFFRSRQGDEALVVTPINEVSFLSWLGGEVRGTSPYCVGQGWEVKYRLMKAYIEGVEALKAVDPKLRILTTEPLINITCRAGADAREQEGARASHEDQFQVLEILGGRICPELRGRPEYLDLLGFNFYYDNQWLHRNHELLIWTQSDPQWIALRDLLATVHRRYGRPVVLSETSHPKEDRPRWVEMIAAECAAALKQGVPLLGVCWYPAIDRPDWDHLERWHDAGLWAAQPDSGGMVGRHLHLPTAEALRQAQTALAGLVPPPSGFPSGRRLLPTYAAA